MKVINDIRIFEYGDDYSDKNFIGDIIEIEEGVYGLLERKIESRDELELRVLAGSEGTVDQMIDDLLEEIFDHPQNKNSAEALIKYLTEKNKTKK
jgi:hypothetical protein